MSTQTRTIKVQIPMTALSMYDRPLFEHHLQTILGNSIKHMGFREGTDLGWVITVEAPMGALLPKDVIGYAKACLRSVGASDADVVELP